MVAVQEAKGAGGRPIIFALSNQNTQAEITAADCYAFSNGATVQSTCSQLGLVRTVQPPPPSISPPGKAIYGSGTRFFEEIVNGQTREPGQVNK